MPKPRMYVRPQGFYPILFRDLVNARRNTKADYKIIIVVPPDAINESDLKNLIKTISKERNPLIKKEYSLLTKHILKYITPAGSNENEGNYRNDIISTLVEKNGEAKRNIFRKITKEDNRKRALRLTINELLTENKYMTLHELLQAKKKTENQPTLHPQTEFELSELVL
ncbi:uncharacterized protein LOC126378725 [Pectinophora gossypiella]|uniref:uncharacterized protein LOC126378725 n=1 Tax=Pectinophora gossypiella TaxID=13191 RepID=UPI00214EEE6A|nr:uncharacterized protein LOC126378725 [Pectinophora gossypiella]